MRALALLALPPLLFLGLYLRTVDYGFVWMDQTEIVEGEILLEPGSLARAFTQPLHSTGIAGFEQLRNPYYRPLQTVLASLIHERFGPVPRWYRLASLAAGFLAVALFTVLAWRLLRSALAAAWAGGFVAAHPVAIEACVWISAMTEPLCAVFVLASLGAALLLLQASGRGRRGALALAAVLALVVALLFKEKGVVVPALLLAALVAGATLNGERPELRRAAAAVLALGGVVAGYLFVWRPVALGSALGLAPPIGGSLTTHAASALASWPGNLAWLFLPLESNASDAVRVVPSLLDPASLLGLGIALASAAAFLWLWRRGLGVAAFGLAWIWIAYLPSANLLPQIHAQGERYLYLSSFGAALLLADVVPRLLRTRASRAGLAVAACAGLVVVGFLAERTWARAPDWRSSLVLFGTDTQRDPYFREGRYHLAKALYEAQRYGAADAQLAWLMSQGADRSAQWSYLNEIGVYQLACRTRVSWGKPQRALELMDSLAARQPGVARVPNLQTCRAQALQALGEHGRAAELLLAVAGELPEEPSAGLSLLVATSLAHLGRADEARSWLARAEAAAGPDPRMRFEIRRVGRMLRERARDPAPR